MRALRGATLGAGHPWADVAACAGIACAYFVGGALCLHLFLRAARANATLALS
jgi:hypothetical protein